MSATNRTPNLLLSKYVDSDKPSWLGDVNSDNDKIDAGHALLIGRIDELQNELNITNAALATANARITKLALDTGHVGD